jgi:prophage regulatory protein
MTDGIEEMLRLRDVLRATGRSKSQLYLDIENGRFPAGVQIGARAVAWPASEVRAWQQARIAERDRQKAA